MWNIAVYLPGVQIVRKYKSARRSAFSLIELVIVVVIIGILAAIAVPRMSRGASAAAEASVASNLATIRNALDVFYTEHGDTYPTLETLPNCLTQYSDTSATTFGTAKESSKGIIYGPYLRNMPSLPVGSNRGKVAFVDAIGGDGGWVYDAATGTVKANCADSEVDARGVKFNTY